MAVLVCSFASERTDPEKLERYISYLAEMRDRNRDDPLQTEAIDVLLRRAQSWMSRKQN